MGNHTTTRNRPALLRTPTTRRARWGRRLAIFIAATTALGYAQDAGWVAKPNTTPTTPPVAVVAPATPGSNVTDDSHQWNCVTMGNHDCGNAITTAPNGCWWEPDAINGDAQQYCGDMHLAPQGSYDFENYPTPAIPAPNTMAT